MSAVPTDDQVLSALRTIRASQPELGLKKIHEKLKQESHFSLSFEVCALRLCRFPCLFFSFPSYSVQRLRRLSNLLFVVRPVEGKELGAIATKAIAPGQCIIRESPIIIAPDASQVLEAIPRLSPAAHKAFFALSAHGPGETVAERIFKSNAHAWASHAALFPTLPRFNHDCTPNCAYQLEIENETSAFFAIRPVEADEELCISYCQRVQPRIVRRKQLSDSYAFLCQCSTCTHPNYHESDRRRQAARNLDDMVPKTKSFKKRLQMIHLRLQLLFEEGLIGPDMARSLNDAVQICAMEGEWEQTRRYAHLSAKMYLRGGNVAASEESRKWIEEPESHPQATKGVKSGKPYTPLPAIPDSGATMIAELKDLLGLSEEEDKMFRDECLREAQRTIDVLTEEMQA